jgi:hypothetical protein
MPNSDLTRRTFVGAAAAVGLMAADDGWIDLFNERDLAGWRPSENIGSWKAVNGELVADGPRRSTGAATESVGPTRAGDAVGTTSWGGG